MTTDQADHLSEEAVNDVLIGMGSPASDSHLTLCPLCRKKVNGFRNQVKLFNGAALAWSDRRAGASVALSGRPKVHNAARWLLGWALAAALVAAIGLPLLHHYKQTAPYSSSASATAQQATEAQIAQDNDLLRAVNVALNQTEESPMRAYHLLEGPHSHTRKRPELRK